MFTCSNRVSSTALASVHHQPKKKLPIQARLIARRVSAIIEITPLPVVLELQEHPEAPAVRREAGEDCGSISCRGTWFCFTVCSASNARSSLKAEESRAW